MRKFPPLQAKVKPLCFTPKYDQDDEVNAALRKSPGFHPSVAFDYRSSLQVIRSNMYEPVSDRCVTTIIKPKYLNRSESVEEYSNEKRNNELVPPEKPPRKNKLKKQQSAVETLNCNNNMKSAENGDATVLDIDNIHLEANNYKKKLIDSSVQTSHLIPYRLRFWPKSSDLKCDPREKGCSKLRFTFCCRILSQWLLSQIGLTIVVILWAMLGAFAFYKTEGPRELEQSAHLSKLQNDIAVELATELRQKDKYLEAWPKTIQHYIEKHEAFLLEAVSAGYGEGGGGSIWTYPGCILFAVSLLTTLGFGAPVPRTALGRASAILFSAIGIPLHFLLILNMGNLGAVKLQRLAFRTSSTDIPTTPAPSWLKWFPVAAIIFYYLMGVILFGFVRRRDAVNSFMFPLDFTAAGGVATTHGHVRILYALYLECAVTLAALVVSLIQASATRGIVDVGLRLGLLTNT